MQIQEAPIKPTKLDDTSKQDNYADRVCTWVSAWDQKRKGLEPRWDRIDQQLRGEAQNPNDLPWDGFVYHNMPMLPAKSQAWESYICNPPLSTTPYLIGTIFGKDSTRAKTVEQDFYLFMRQAEWGMVFRQVVHSVGAYGKGIWRVAPKQDDYGRISIGFEHVPLRRFGIYPDVPQGIKYAKAVWHTFELRASEVVERQNKGELWEGVSVTGKKTIPDAPQQSSKTMNNRESIAKDPDDFPVRIAEMFIKDKLADDEFEKWYRLWIALDDKKVLGCWDYPYSRPWFFDQFCHLEEGSFLPETSRFGDGQDLQLATNELWNLMSAGSQMAAFPTQYSVGWALPQKYAKSKPGQVVPLTAGGSMSQVNSRFDIAAFPQLLNYVDKKSSEIFRLDEQQLGVKTANDQTATAAQIRQGGAQIAITDDLSAMDVCIGQIGAFMQEIYRVHYPDFLEDYGDTLAVQPDDSSLQTGNPEILDKPIIWELMGKSPFNTPMAQSQAAMQLFTALGQVANPQAMMVLLTAGVNVPAIIQEIVSNSTLENRSAILVNPAYSGEDPQQTMQAMQQMMSQISEMNQQKPVPKPPIESIPYQFAPPYIQAQMEMQAGMKPDPNHAVGMPSPGSDQHTNMMQNLHNIHQAKNQPPEAGGPVRAAPSGPPPAMGPGATNPIPTQ